MAADHLQKEEFRDINWLDIRDQPQNYQEEKDKSYFLRVIDLFPIKLLED